MHFMVMHKMTQEREKAFPPDPALTARVRALIEEAKAKNIFVSGEGLKPSSERVHVAYKDGKRVITDGPFTEAKELVAGFAVMKVRSKEEAISWCDRFAALIGDVELFMGPVVEPWDLGVMPKPKDAPLRYLSMHKLDDKAEHDTPPDPAAMAQMGALIEEMTKAGVLQSTGGLGSTKHGTRIRFEGGKRTSVMDGPFAESKELVAGFMIVDLPSKADAIEWATRFGEIVNVSEVEVRPVPQW